MSWTAILVLAAGSYAIKALGLLVLGDQRVHARLSAVAALLPAALFGGLIAVMTFAHDEHLVLDARVAGLAAGGVAAARRAPFVVTVLIAMAAAATVRAV